GAPVVVDAGTRAGYLFSGWTINRGDVVLPNNPQTSFIMPPGNVAVTAVWVSIDENIIEAYNKVYAEFCSYYDIATWQFRRDLFVGYSVESVLEAERIMGVGCQLHADLLAMYGKLDAGRFNATDPEEAIKVSTRILTQAIADMNTVLKPLDVPVLFANAYDMSGFIRVWFSYPVGIESVVAMIDGTVTGFDGVILSGARTWLTGVGYIDAYSYVDVAKVNNWQSIVLTLTVSGQMLTLELVNDQYTRR
ncbi:MAG: hypothetical protein LBI79_08615, partial [Nitrososphaerota archaeon]|nr:hypothetical protein [Nitrososphaerota archaeon]